jgi:hypothetical protein
LTSVVPLQPAHATGILLLGAAAGAPFLPKLAELSLRSTAYSVALMVLLMGGSIIFMPFALPLMIPGLSADPWAIAKPLLVVIAIPLAIGFALALSKAAWVGGLPVAARNLSNVTMVLLIVLMVGLNFKTLLGTLGSFAIGTYMLYLSIIIGNGYRRDRPADSECFRAWRGKPEHSRLSRYRRFEPERPGRYRDADRRLPHQFRRTARACEGDAARSAREHRSLMLPAHEPGAVDRDAQYRAITNRLSLRPA